MIKGFWNDLPRPFFCMAPMADVTDAAFRQIIAKYGKPDVMWTEFVSADGLCHPAGRDKLLIDLSYTESERPIVAQLFTGKPEKMREAAALVKKLGFDGIDINMGCPDRGVEKQGAGAALIKNPKQARAVIKAAIDGVRLRQGFGGQAGGLPVSVKTRTGYNKRELETWIPELLKEDISALTIHARTRKEMSDVPANWQDVKTVVDMVKASGKEVLVIGNGDVRDLADGREKAEFSGADGVMLGRAIFGNPFLFSNSQEFENRTEVEMVRRKLEVMIEHTNLFEKLFIQGGLTPAPTGQTSSRFAQQGMSLFGTRARSGNGAGFNIRDPQFIIGEKDNNGLRANIKNFAVMKKHYKAYANGFDGAKELRLKLMETNSALEVENIVNDFLKTIS